MMAAELTLFQFNALSLKQVKTRAIIREQISRRGTHVAFYKEHRMRDDGIYTSKYGIHVYSSATDGGHLGCAIDISTNVPFGYRKSGSPIYVNRNHVGIAFAHPRLFLITVTAPAIRFLLVSACQGSARFHIGSLPPKPYKNIKKVALS